MLSNLIRFARGRGLQGSSLQLLNMPEALNAISLTGDGAISVRKDVDANHLSSHPPELADRLHLVYTLAVGPASRQASCRRLFFIRPRSSAAPTRRELLAGAGAPGAVDAVGGIEHAVEKQKLNSPTRSRGRPAVGRWAPMSSLRRLVDRHQRDSFFFFFFLQEKP